MTANRPTTTTRVRVTPTGPVIWHWFARGKRAALICPAGWSTNCTSCGRVHVGGFANRSRDARYLTAALNNARRHLASAHGHRA